MPRFARFARFALMVLLAALPYAHAEDAPAKKDEYIAVKDGQLTIHGKKDPRMEGDDPEVIRDRIISGARMGMQVMGLIMYTEKHQDRFPEPDGVGGLLEMQEEGLLSSGRGMKNPRDNRVPTAELIEANLSFAYFGAGLRNGMDDAERIPIMIEKPCSDPWIYMLFADGHHEGMPFTGKSLEDAITAWIVHCAETKPLADKVQAMLLEKAKALDVKLAAADAEAAK